MTSTTEPYTAAASQWRSATEKSTEVWRKGAKAVTDQTDLVSALPTVDLTQGVERYFELVQRTVDANREFATRWVELLSSLTGTVREQAEKVSSLVGEQADKVGDLVAEQAARGEQAANEQAEQAEEAEQEQAKLARQAERAAAKQAKEQAREPYEGLTKAELADRLAERELPKTGTVEDLIERLVSADSS